MVLCLMKRTIMYHNSEESVLLSRLDSPRRPRTPYCQGFKITLKNNTLATNPLDE